MIFELIFGILYFTSALQELVMVFFLGQNEMEQ